jgi:hypothetical protein
MRKKLSMLATGSRYLASENSPIEAPLSKLGTKTERKEVKRQHAAGGSEEGLEVATHVKGSSKDDVSSDCDLSLLHLLEQVSIANDSSGVSDLHTCLVKTGDDSDDCSLGDVSKIRDLAEWLKEKKWWVGQQPSLPCRYDRVRRTIPRAHS